MLRRLWLVLLLLSTAGFGQESNQQRDLLSRCLAGTWYCDRSQLSSDEAAQVAELERRRNLVRCLRGASYCNHSQLSFDQRERVAELERQRFFDHLDRVAELERQRFVRLISEADARVAEEQRQRNLLLCQFSWFCDVSLLRPEEAAQLGRLKSNFDAPALSGTAGVAENGSYYGEPNVNGVPKTVHVDGYYRQDGTHVRGHYRSPPNSNPWGAKSH